MTPPPSRPLGFLRPRRSETRQFFFQIPLDTGSLVVDAEVVSQGPQQQTKGVVRLKASDANSGVVFVGYRANLTPGDGYPLLAGQEIELRILDLSLFYAVADLAGQRLHWVIM